VVGIELFAETSEYDWEPVASAQSFRRVTLFRNSMPQGVRNLNRALEAVLDESRPEEVFVPGWAGPGAAAAIRWCQRASVPAIVMSESTTMDEPRMAWKEAVKRQVVRCFAAGLVGGQRHIEYAVQLGLTRERVFAGYDAVDNDHFAAGADAARNDRQAVRERLGLPEQYFLASCRFIPKKNLTRLLHAFAVFLKTWRHSPWHLVLLGNGPERSRLERLRSELGLNNTVFMPGFKQYGDLPAYYGLANVFVHASTTEQWGLVVNEAMATGLPVIVSDRCGCSPDLVEEGVNGFLFNPTDTEKLAGRMRKLAEDERARQRFGQESRRIIGNWSLDRFAEGFWQAADLARSCRPRRASVISRILLGVLAHYK